MPQLNSIRIRITVERRQHQTTPIQTQPLTQNTANLVGELAETAAQAAKRNAEYNLQIKSFEDTISVCNNLQEFIKDDDIILVKGSRVAKLEMAVEKLKELFS